VSNLIQRYEEELTLAVIIFVAHIIVFLYAFVFGALFYLGFGLEAAANFALFAAFFSFLGSLPGFVTLLEPGRRSDVALAYLFSGMAAGMAVVCIVSLLMAFIRLLLSMTGMPQQEIIHPAAAAFCCALIAVGFALRGADLERHDNSREYSYMQ